MMQKGCQQVKRLRTTGLYLNFRVNLYFDLLHLNKVAKLSFNFLLGALVHCKICKSIICIITLDFT